MGDLFGGDQSTADTSQEQFNSYMPSFNPYEQLPMGMGAGQLLGGVAGATPISGPGFTPTGGWMGSGNAGLIPGAASQLLRMRQSPVFTWR